MTDSSLPTTLAQLVARSRRLGADRCAGYVRRVTRDEIADAVG